MFGRSVARTRLRRRALGAAAALVAAVAVPVVLATPAHALYTQCPPMGASSGCNSLITVSATPPITTGYHVDPLQPFHNGDDTLLGVFNESRTQVVTLTITSPTSKPIFRFDGTEVHGPGVTITPATTCPAVCHTGKVEIDFGPVTESCEAAYPTPTSWFSLEGTSLGLLDITVETSPRSPILAPWAEASAVEGIGAEPIGHAGPIENGADRASVLAHETAGPVEVEAVRATADTEYHDSGTAEVYLARVRVTVGAYVVEATDVRATARVVCRGGYPITFSATSSVGRLDVNGVTIVNANAPQVLGTPPCMLRLRSGGTTATSAEVTAIDLDCGARIRLATARVSVQPYL